ncbi:MAG: BNR/Asp-box repeat-containing protein [Methylococcaceae bacterium NSP1-2]|nr:glycoside hydrolase [Methylococcaceae bacterium]OYV16421.1 MAG: BNR/Asp-box repeat-containing protein [Methylococcaceae bacterium NSP1-2]
MKPLYWLILSSFILSACTTTTDSKPPLIAESSSKSTKKMSHKPPKKGICADSKAPPLSKCADTVTATSDNKGTLWAVWTNNQSIYIQSSTDKGNRFTAPVLVNTTPEKVAAENESRPKIKIDAKGNIYLTWVITLDEKRSTYVRFSRSTDGGKHFSTPVTVNDNLQIIRHRFDSLAVGKNGEIFVAWLDARDTEAAKKAGKEFKGLSLYYSTSTDGGKHFSPNKSIADHVCECCRIDTTVAPDNTPVVVWRHIFEGGIRDHALVKFKDWQTPDTIQRLSHEDWKIDACPHHGPAIAIADSGIYHAVWFSGSASKQGLFYGYSTDAGKSFSEPVNFGKEGTSHPHVLALDKQVFVTWQAFDGKINRALVIKSNDEGKTWAKPEVIAQTPEMADEPFLISDGQNEYLSWQSAQKDYQLIAIK